MIQPKTMRIKNLIMTTITLLTGLGANASDADSLMVMRGFPTDEVGIEQGVSACYAGRIDDQLVMAGGCNFPCEYVGLPIVRRFIIVVFMLP